MKLFISALLRNPLFFLTSIFLIFLCCENQTDNETFHVSGKIEELKDNTMIILQDNAEGINIDTTFAMNETFSFTGSTTYPKSARVYFKSGDRYEEIVFMLENTEIDINAKGHDLFMRAEVRGGPEQALQREYESLAYEEYSKYKTLRDSFFLIKKQTGKYDSPLGKKFSLHARNFSAIARDLALKHPNSYWSLGIFNSQKTKLDQDTLTWINQNSQFQNPKFQPINNN